MTSKNENSDRPIGRIAGIFVWLAGSSEEILRQCPQAEQIKHQAIGATVLVPTLFGFLASLYTTYSLGVSWFISLGIATFWAFVIVTIDRMLLASYRKERNQWIQAVTRLLVAGLMGLVIAHPVVLWAFRDTISTQIDEWRKAEVAEVRQTAAAEMKVMEDQKGQHLRALRKNLEVLHGQSATMENDLTILRRDLASYIRLRNEEVDGKRGSGQKGIGPIAKDLEENSIKPTEAAIAQTEKKLAEARQEIANVTAKIDEAGREFSQDNEIAAVRGDTREQVQRAEERRRGDLLGQMKALHELEEKYPFMGHAKLTLLMLFFLLDSMALISKLLCPKGPYDDLVAMGILESSEDLRVFTENYAAVASQKVEARLNREIHEAEINSTVEQALSPLRGANRLIAGIGEQTFQALSRIDDLTRMAAKAKSGEALETVNGQIDALVKTLRQASSASIRRYDSYLKNDFPDEKSNPYNNGSHINRL